MKTRIIEPAVGGSSKGDFCARSKGDSLKRKLSQDFRPAVLWRKWRLADDPELALWMMDQADGRAFGIGNGPTTPQEVYLVIGIDSAA